VSSSDIPSTAQPNAEPDGMRAALSTPASSFSMFEYPLPASSPLATPSVKRLRGPDGQPVAFQKRTASVSEVISTRLPASSMENRIVETQLAEERRRVSETAVANRDDNGKQVERDEEDPTDGEADVEETAAMSTKDGEVWC
jgi:hypothetical protein